MHSRRMGLKACGRAGWKPVPPRAGQPTVVCGAVWLQQSSGTFSCYWVPAKCSLLAAKLVLCLRKGIERCSKCHLLAALVWKQIAIKRKAPEPVEEGDEADLFGRSSARSSGAGAAAQAGAGQVGPTDQAAGQVPVAEATAPGDSSQVRLVGGLAAPLDAAWSQYTLFCVQCTCFWFWFVVQAPGQSDDSTPLVLTCYESCLCIVGKDTFCLHSSLAASAFGCLCILLQCACTLEGYAAALHACHAASLCKIIVPEGNSLFAWSADEYPVLQAPAAKRHKARASDEDTTGDAAAEDTAMDIDAGRHMWGFHPI